MPEKVFLAGANGFIGSKICAELFSKGYEIYGLVLQSSEYGFIKPYVKKIIEGDLTDESSVQNIINEMKKNGIKKIINAVGSVDYHQDYESAQKFNVRTVRNIIDVALLLHREKLLDKIIFIGSVASRGFLEKEPRSREEDFNENTDNYKKGISVYCDVKHEAEEIIRSAISRNNLPAVIIEPGSLVGRGLGETATTSYGLILKILRGFPVLRGGMSYTSLSRLAEGIVLALEKGKIGETYLLGGENMTMRGFAVLIKDLYSLLFGKKSIFFIPILSIPEEIAKILGKFHIAFNEQQALLGSSYHYINSEKAMKELGYRHSPEDLKKAVMEVLNALL